MGLSKRQLQGPTGPQGPQGPQGPAGSAGSGSGTSKWAGKKWNVVGDSITGHSVVSKPYQDFIAEKIGSINTTYGVGGSGWFVGDTNAFYQRISPLDANADLITVFGGTNDWANIGKTLVLGNLGDTDPSVSFYGAIDSTIKQLITKFPTKTIAVFTPLPRDAGYVPNATTGIYLEQVADAIKKGCNKWSIPVLDLYHESNFYPWDNNFKTYAMPDALHPNITGHGLLADKILAFLNGL